MGTLLEFKGQKKSAEARQRFAGEAQILIFTGVRYERGTPPPPTGIAAKGRKRKRV